jgi:hypothetical protein
VGALVLLLGISVQLLYWQRDALASQPATRPLAEQLCRLFACQLPAMRDVSAIRLLQRSVYSHPNVSNALIIRLSMSNEASFAQPYPTLAIRMTDRQGRTVAARDFKPTVYLGDGALQQTMPPGQPVTVTLEVLDPGRDARSYELDFL